MQHLHGVFFVPQTSQQGGAVLLPVTSGGGVVLDQENEFCAGPLYF